MDAAEFAKHVNHINEAGFTSLLLSLGEKLGLFNLMMKENRPMTSQELAEAAGMKERYIREWLCGLVAGKIVIYDPEKKTFSIPEQYHETLKASPAWTGGIAAYCSREEEVLKCFMKDGPYGIDYDNDDHLWKWFGRWRMIVCADIVEKSLVPSLKGTTIPEKLDTGVNVLDVCCGSGEITLQFAKLFPKTTFTGLDFFDIPRTKAIERAKAAGLGNVSIIGGDVHNLPDEMSGKYDMVFMFDALHDLPDPHKALSEVHKVLKPDGVFVLMEFGLSSNLEDHIGNLNTSMMYACSVYCCLPSSLSEEPRVGYGPCWGTENIKAALEEKYKIEKDIKLSPVTYLFICTK